MMFEIAYYFFKICSWTLAIIVLMVCVVCSWWVLTPGMILVYGFTAAWWKIMNNWHIDNMKRDFDD